MTKSYLVRQYRPNYFTDFGNDVYSNVTYDGITRVPFCDNFKQPDFTHFTVKPYVGDELIIQAHYASGKPWVVGFALPADSDSTAPDGGLLRENWRYRPARPHS